MNNYYSILIIFSFVIFWELFLTNKISLIRINSHFDDVTSKKFYKFLTNSSRYIGSIHYNNTILYILNHLKELHSQHQDNFTYFFHNPIILSSEKNEMYVYHQNFSNIIINFPKNSSKTLYLISHLDSHNVGVSAYDNAINSAMLIGIINSLLKNNISLDFNLTILLI